MAAAAAEERAAAARPKWIKWLQGVDHHIFREEAWLQEVVDYLLRPGKEYWSPGDLVGCKGECMDDLPRGPKGAFLMRCVGCAEANARRDESERVGVRAPVTPPPGQLTQASQQGASVQGPLDAIVAAMGGAAPKQPEKQVLRIGKELCSVNLAWLPASAWPSQDLVEELAEDCVKFSAKVPGGWAFSYVDLAKKCLPFWAATLTCEEEEEEKALESVIDASCGTLGSIASVLQKAAKPAKKSMSFPQWLSAFQKCAVAQAVTKQWNYASSQAHMEVCLRVGEGAKANGRFHSLAIIYDEVARRSFAEKVKAGVPDFDLDAASAVLDKELLDKAQSVFDERRKKEKAGANHGRQQNNGWQQNQLWPPPSWGNRQWSGKRQREGGDHGQPPWKKRPVY